VPVKPTFTAVIPAYNAESTLGSAIRSVLSQTRGDFELVVVDDGSRDRTPAVAESFQSDPRVRIVRHENRGPASARNTGIASSRGRLVAFLDSDDLWMPQYLEALGGALESNPDAGFAYTDGWVLDDATRRIARRTVMAGQRPPVPPPPSAEEFLRMLVRRNFVPAEAMVRKATLDDVGGFNESLPALEDYELWLRILSHGYRAVRPPGLLLVRRDRADSLSKDPRLMWGAHETVWRLLVEQHPAPEDVKVIARAQMRALDRKLAALDGRIGPHAVARRVRHILGRVRRRLLSRRLWCRKPPAEVARAFPDLRSV
jgi:glycosyltransferase involved in cell wall biosynthesis